MSGIPHYPDLAGKVALVTGGSRGIGAETCRRLAAGGAAVAVGGRDPEALGAVVADIEAAGGRAVAVAADVTTSAGVEEMRHEVERALGPVELIAAVAGGDGPNADRALPDVTDDDWHAVLELNLSATFFTLRSFLPGMMERGRGAIVLMSSTAARRQTAGPWAYTAAKAGILGMMRKAAAEAGPRGVRVNSVAPSYIPTDTRVVDLSQDYIAEHWPLGRLGTPADVANAMVYLLSDEAAGWLTGITIDVAGGRVMP